MTTIVGIGGFICGFALGLTLAGMLLRRRSRTELVQSKSLRWTYGLAIWIMGGLGAWSALEIYYTYFPAP